MFLSHLDKLISKTFIFIVKKTFKGNCFPKSVILHVVYLKLRFSLNYRDIEELLSIRGVKVDHATIQCWVFKFTPQVEQQLRKRKKSVGKRWRMDETYIKVKGNGDIYIG